YTQATTNPIGPMNPDAELKFDYRFVDYDESTPTILEDPENLQVQISTDFGQTFDTIYTIDNTNHTATAAFTPKRVSLAAYDSGYIVIRFVAQSHVFSDNDYFVMIDNVSIQETPNVPIFNYAPSSLNFGFVQVGDTSAAQNVTVTNTGGGRIDLSTANISIIGANPAAFGYTSTNLPASLGAGEAVNIPVFAAPQAEGNFNATLRITFNGVNYDVSLAYSAVAPGTVIMGTGTSNNNIPVYPYYGYTYSQSIYLANEINYNVPGHRIEKIAYYWNGAGVGTNSSEWVVYMGHTGLNSFVNTSNSWIPANQLTQVFNGTLSIPATAGWIEIELDNPFFYNGISNLVIAVDENKPGYDGSSQFFYSTLSGTGRSLVAYSDSTNPNPESVPPGGSASLKSAYPNLRLKFGEPPTIPEFFISDTEVDFGRTMVRDIKTHNITIRNIGGGSLDISNIAISGTYFSLSANPAPVSLGAGEMTTVSVQYSPQVVGEHTGIITITDGRTITTVSLAGNSFDPTISSFPYLQNFDGDWTGTPAAPLDWTVINANNDSYTWKRANTYITPTHSQPYAAHGSGNNNDWLITPPIDLTNDYVKIKWWDRVEGASQPSSYRVYVSTTGSSIGAFDELLVDITCTNTVWSEHEINLSAYHGQIVFIGFHQYYSYSSAWGFGIDDFSVESIPTHPILGYSPEALNFGTVSYNTPTPYVNITISNQGMGDLELTADDLSLIGNNADLFDINTSNFPVALGPAQFVNVPINLTSTVIGEISAIFRITYDGEDYDIPLSAWGLPEGTVVIGGDSQNLSMPVHPYYGYTYSQTIYKQPEIATADKRIETIAYYWNGAGVGTNSSEWTVYMGHTELENFDSTTSWIPVNEMTQVFSGSLNIPAVEGWIIIPLDVPYIYNNVDNLVIAVDENRPSYDGNSQYFYSTTDAGTRSIRYYNDSTNPDPAAPPTGTLVSGFPNIMMMFGDLPTAPIFSYNPESLDFGTVFQNEPSAWKNVSITNLGVGSLEIAAGDISLFGTSADMFELDTSNLPASLAFTETVQIPVRFTATADGIQNATLRIQYAGENYDVALTGAGFPTGTQIIGEGTASQRYPFGVLYGYERSASLYTQEQIGNVGMLDFVAWNVATTSTVPTPYKIYAGTTEDAAFTLQPFDTLIGNLTLVKQGTYTFDTPGWNGFALDTPFPYFSGNLIIAVETNFGGGGSSPSPSIYYTTSGANSHIYWVADNAPPTTNGSANTSRPNLLLNLSPGADGIPAQPFLRTPADNATGLFKAGFELSWMPDLQFGGDADYYTVYLAPSEDDIFDSFFFETPNRSFNPVAEGNMEFEYLQEWYWTVQATNEHGSALATEIRRFTIEADPRIALPYSEGFGTDANWPLNWIQTFGGNLSSNRWSKVNSSVAGGTPYEMRAMYQNAIGTSRLISPPLLTDGVQNLSVNFKHYMDDFRAGGIVKLQYSTDLVNWQDAGWFVETGNGDVEGDINVIITGIESPQVYLAWTTDQDHYGFDYWYVDDISIEAYEINELASPVVSIEQSETGLALSWEAVENATQYLIYAANNPYGDWELIQVTTSTNYDIVSPGNRMFYKVIASDAAIRSK
ncbi:MAG: choice-of-anchor D domain-containing protein, partial [Candidatus Cloacimonadaceae bacterium]